MTKIIYDLDCSSQVIDYKIYEWERTFTIFEIIVTDSMNIDHYFASTTIDQREKFFNFLVAIIFVVDYNYSYIL